MVAPSNILLKTVLNLAEDIDTLNMCKNGKQKELIMVTYNGKLIMVT